MYLKYRGTSIYYVFSRVESAVACREWMPRHAATRSRSVAPVLLASLIFPFYYVPCPHDDMEQSILVWLIRSRKEAPSSRARARRHIWLPCGRTRQVWWLPESRSLRLADHRPGQTWILQWDGNVTLPYIVSCMPTCNRACQAEFLGPGSPVVLWSARGPRSNSSVGCPVNGSPKYILKINQDKENVRKSFKCLVTDSDAFGGDPEIMLKKPWLYQTKFHVRNAGLNKLAESWTDLPAGIAGRLRQLQLSDAHSSFRRLLRPTQADPQSILWLPGLWNQNRTV